MILMVEVAIYSIFSLVEGQELDSIADNGQEHGTVDSSTNT